MFEIVKQIVCAKTLLLAAQVSSKEYFRVYGKLVATPNAMKIAGSLKEFEKINFNGEVFYPLLVKQYSKILCYKMEKINFSEYFRY